MEYSGFDFHELAFAQVQGVAKGAFAQVALIAGAELVIKVASDGAHDHFVREKRVYERLGRHSYILRSYGESKVVSSERAMVGLLLQYQPAGTFAAMLPGQQFPDCADKVKEAVLIASLNPVLMRYIARRLVQATEAVRYIHSKGIIHGDLGSHNFLIQNDGTIALADFGGSRIDGSECLEHPPARYTRPAVISQLGLPPTEKDDLFGLGTILFEISTCRQLYQDKTENEIRDLFAQQIFPDLAPIAIGMRLVIGKCWKGEYNSAEAVSGDTLGNITFQLQSLHSSTHASCSVSLHGTLFYHAGRPSRYRRYASEYIGLEWGQHEKPCRVIASKLSALTSQQSRNWVTKVLAMVVAIYPRPRLRRNNAKNPRRRGTLGPRLTEILLDERQPSITTAGLNEKPSTTRQPSIKEASLG
ncbi:hypothetical protein B7494_g4751 [Chlorociboria aeruginascens]|nr:hypothetical protein B7494_g4751 [Chlorociboria aeruginascens]